MIKKKEKVMTVSIGLRPSEIKRLKALAKKFKITMSEVVRQLLTQESKDV